jgi:hypothetical protein
MAGGSMAQPSGVMGRVQCVLAFRPGWRGRRDDFGSTENEASGDGDESYARIWVMAEI